MGWVEGGEVKLTRHGVAAVAIILTLFDGPGNVWGTYSAWTLLFHFPVAFDRLFALKRRNKHPSTHVTVFVYLLELSSCSVCSLKGLTQL